MKRHALSDFRVIPIDSRAAILLYEAEQRATCGGRVVPPFMHAASVYVRRRG